MITNLKFEDMLNRYKIEYYVFDNELYMFVIFMNGYEMFYQYDFKKTPLENFNYCLDYLLYKIDTKFIKQKIILLKEEVRRNEEKNKSKI